MKHLINFYREYDEDIKRIFDAILLLVLIIISPYFSDNLPAMPDWIRLSLYIIFLWAAVKFILIVGHYISKRY